MSRQNKRTNLQNNKLDTYQLVTYWTLSICSLIIWVYAPLINSRRDNFTWLSKSLWTAHNVSQIIKNENSQFKSLRPRWLGWKIGIKVRRPEGFCSTSIKIIFDRMFSQKGASAFYAFSRGRVGGTASTSSPSMKSSLKKKRMNKYLKCFKKNISLLIIIFK